MRAGNYYLVIVGHHDNPIFEMEFTPDSRSDEPKKDDHRHLNQFVAHEALYLVDEQMWATYSMYFKIVDKFNEWLVLCICYCRWYKVYNVAWSEKWGWNKDLFDEMYEIYIKFSMNPFYEINKPIISPAFEKNQFFGRKYLQI